jgi:hypothetical protein
VLQTIRRNLGLKLLALALAVTAWAYFHFSAAASITAHFDEQLTVPIVVTGLQPGFAAQLGQRIATVTVESPRNGPPAKADQIEAVLDLADRNVPGVINVPVKIVAPDLVIKSFSPASETLVFDRVASRSVPVAITFTGNSGALVVISSRTDPRTATVRGIATDVAKVAQLSVDIPLGGSKPGELDAMIRPLATDARGASVGGIDMSPNLVRVRARFAPATNSAGVRS